VRLTQDALKKRWAHFVAASFALNTKNKAPKREPFKYMKERSAVH